MAKARIDPELRFWSKISKADDCWVWRNANVKGYGVFWDGQRRIRAHVFSYQLKHGPVPAGMVICHTCDNPPCCNPDHLYAGTHAQNNADRVSRGRSAPGQAKPPVRRGPRLAHTKLTAEAVRQMRERKKAGETYRQLAEAFSVNLTTAYDAITGKNWRYL